MRSLSVHPNHNIYIYILIFISLFYLFFYLKKKLFHSVQEKRNCQVYQQKKGRKFNTDDLVFRKESNLPSETLLSLSSYVDIEYNPKEIYNDRKI